MSRVLGVFCRCVTVILFFCMLGMVATMASLVLTRYVFSFSPPWSEEVTRYLMVWMVMLGGAVLVLFDDHITLYLFVEKLGRRAQLLQLILVRVIIASVSAVTAWTGWGFATSMWSVIAPGTQWPMFFPTVAVPVSFTLCTLFAVLLILRDLGSLFGHTPGPLPKQSDHMYGSFRPAEEVEDTP